MKVYEYKELPYNVRERIVSNLDKVVSTLSKDKWEIKYIECVHGTAYVWIEFLKQINAYDDQMKTEMFALLMGDSE